jgi:hypothetical protein
MTSRDGHDQCVARTLLTHSVFIDVNTKDNDGTTPSLFGSKK